MVPEELREHPDRLRWNARYEATAPGFARHPLAAEALAAGLPDGPVLELACGRSGNALEFAAAGRMVVAVDISDLALTQLAEEANRRSLGERIECVCADVPAYDPGPERFALVLATLYWDPAAFSTGCRAVFPGGLLAWDALRADGDAGQYRIPHGELSTRLPEGFTVLAEDAPASEWHRTTRLLARHSA